VEATVKRMLILPMLVLVLLPGLSSCSNDEGQAYQRGYESGYLAGIEKGEEEGTQKGYEKGFAEGQQQGLIEGRKAAEANARDSYKKGYEEGFAESNRLFGPREELVKVLSYRLRRYATGEFDVRGELQNVSNKRLHSIKVSLAMLNSKGEIINVSSPTYIGSLDPQERAFFPSNPSAEFNFGYGPEVIDVRINVQWD
jgi:hypothetical protein